MTDPAGDLLSLPPPQLSTEAVADLAERYYGLTGTLTRLTSERDLNHLLRGADGRGYVLKLANPAEPPEQTDFQIAALDHIARVDPALAVPRAIRALDGASSLPLPEGRFRVLSYLEGRPLHAAPASDGQRRALGAAAARLTHALRDFHHPAADHVLLWDIKQVPRLGPLVPAIGDAALRARAAAFVEGFTTRLAPRLAQLPTQVVHADLNPHNVVVAADDPAVIAGILDFGDMVRTPRLCDLAVAASYQIDRDRPMDSLLALCGGYLAQAGQAGWTLGPDEMDLLPDLVVARMITTVTIAHWRAARYPDNAPYILRNLPSARAGLEAMGTIPPAALRAALDPLAKGATR